MKKTLAATLALFFALAHLGGAADENESPGFSSSRATVLQEGTLAGIEGALGRKTTCALAFTGLAIGLFAGSLASGGLAAPAIGAAFAGNVAAACLL